MEELPSRQRIFASVYLRSQCLFPKPNSLLQAKPGKRPFICVRPSRILATNKKLPLKFMACVAMIENPVHRKFSRHVEIHRYFKHRLVKAGSVKLIPLHTHKMVADALTKSLPLARLHWPPPCHDGPNAVCFEVFALLMRLCFPFYYFFHSIPLHNFFSIAQCVL